LKKPPLDPAKTFHWESGDSPGKRKTYRSHFPLKEDREEILKKLDKKPLFYDTIIAGGCYEPGYAGYKK
jgi:hypothetical protein